MSGFEEYITTLEDRVEQLHVIIELLRRENGELRDLTQKTIDRLHADNVTTQAYLAYLKRFENGEE
tara:strand:- start:2015 stop:2212 length:198 start_codon:yes stop_codon:yes gene_type:complete